MDAVVNRRGFLAAVPSIALAGCAARLGLADRVEVAVKAVRLHPRDGGEPIDAVVRRYDADEGVSYDDDVHDAVADEIDPDGPLVVPESLAERLEAQFETAEYRVRVCELSDGACRLTSLVRPDFNEVEAGDVIDIVSRSSGAGLVEVHEQREQRD